MRINIGCGQTPTAGWRNYDNSLSIRFLKISFLSEFLYKIRIISSYQYNFISFARENNIEYGDAAKGLSVHDDSCEVVYCSHMLEHLDRVEAAKFLDEVFRILRPGGIVRVAVPDIRKQVEQYNISGDADAFIEATHLCVDRPRSLIQRLKLLLVGTRQHQWMYDGKSLCKLFEKHGFVGEEILPAGKTKIQNHEPLNLQERVSESVYVEAVKPIV